MADKLTKREQLYLEEIEAWKKASEIHADNAISQYKIASTGLEKIHFEKKRNEAILGQLNDGVIVFDGQHQIIIFNNQAENFFGMSATQALSQNFDNLMESFNPEILTYTRKQLLKNAQFQRHTLLNNKRYISCRLDIISIESDVYYLLLLEDVDDFLRLQQALKKEKKSLEKRVNNRTDELQKEIAKKEQAKQLAEKLSLTDMLTELPNRRAFLIELSRCISQSELQNDFTFSLLFIDLDGFKSINDTLGHYAGDVLLIEVSKRIQNAIRNLDVCARLGGDEFVILIENFSDEERITEIANTLLSSIAEAVQFNDTQQMNVSASIGIYLHQPQGKYFNSSSILTMADEAMYEAKQRGKNGYVVFDQGLFERMAKSNSLIQKLNLAFINKEFLVYFQPICDVNGKIIGAESLARWQHKGEMISPAEFIPLLEQRGQINTFTLFVIETVFLALLQNEHFPSVSINLSILQFYDENFIEYVDEMFMGLPELRKKIGFEITESLLHKDPKILIKGIKELRKRGFKVYIDDFGTGYSSFSYIRNFSADVVKIDREFVVDIENNPRNYLLLKGMVALLESMALDIVIEGVENEQQLTLIQAMSQQIKIQGYYFYRPMPFDEILELLVE